MDHPALSPQQIVAEFQRRRRVAFRIRNWTAAIGFGGVFAGVLLVRTLTGNPSPWIFAPVVLALVIAVCGSIYAPHLYRCPRCGRRVRVPDTTDPGYIMPKDPTSCPRCGVILK
jgi:DNA-directed RNA polymerase subunit RPC12/RpoP